MIKASTKKHHELLSHYTWLSAICSIAKRRRLLQGIVYELQVLSMFMLLPICPPSITLLP